MGKKRRSRQFREKSQVIDIEQARKNRRNRRQQIKEKDESAKKNVKKAPRLSKRRATKAVRRRLVYLAIVATLILVVTFTVLHLLSLKKSEVEEQNRKEALAQEKARLEQELSQVGSPEYVEDKARNELHMVKPGETIYVVPEKQESDMEDAAGESSETQEDAEYGKLKEAK